MTGGWPKLMSKRVVPLSRWADIVEREIEFTPGDEPQTYHAVGQCDYIGMLALTPDGKIPLVRQYRHPAVRYLLETPAGTLDEGERPEDGAARELQEELGLVAGRMEKLSEFFVSPGFCEEKMWVFLATELTEGRQQPDEDEVLDVVRLPIDEALEMISSGEIQDAKTIIALILAAPRVGSPFLDTQYPAV